MKKAAYIWAAVVALLVHVDWHIGRGGHHRLSFDCPLHWILGVAGAAALAAFLIKRYGLMTIAVFNVITIAGFILGQIVEPMGEVIFYQDSFHEVYGNGRWNVFNAFATAWLITGALVYLLAISSRIGRPRE